MSINVGGGELELKPRILVKNKLGGAGGNTFNKQ